MGFFKRQSDASKREQLIRERDELATKLITEMQEAIRSDPSNATLHVVLAKDLFDLGRLAEARAESETALNLDPMAPLGNDLMSEITRLERRSQLGF